MLKTASDQTESTEDVFLIDEILRSWLVVVWHVGGIDRLVKVDFINHVSTEHSSFLTIDFFIKGEQKRDHSSALSWHK